MSRLIDADALKKDLRKCQIESLIAHTEEENVFDIINNQPTAYDVENVVAELEEKTDFLKDCTKYGNKDAEQQEKSYSIMMMYEIADLVDDLIDIVKRGGIE